MDHHGLPNSKAGKKTKDTIAMGTDNLRPATDIHVLAGCQQPEACLRQQSQNQAINMGITFVEWSFNKCYEVFKVKYSFLYKIY